MKRPVTKIERIAPVPSKPISWEVVLGPTDAIGRGFTILWREQEVAYPDNRTALIAASETASDAAVVQTVLIVLGEIPPSKLLEIFH
jgi:hypothetical protein